ncbi:MAG: acetylxylan esterase, partial [Victivallales bacterium]|nr:acetylxylan esterase [Victivallales bacterium]
LDQADGIYKSGEAAKGTVEVFTGGKPVKNFKGKYQISFERETVDTGEIVSGNKPVILERKSDRPGWLYFHFELLSANGKAVQTQRKVIGEAGVLFDPGRITASAEPPADFAGFWEKNREELNKIPLKAKLEAVALPEKFKGKVECQAVTVDCLSKYPVTGYLAVPAGSAGKKLPAFVHFLSHTQRDTRKEDAAATAMRGALAFYVTWHGLPVNQPQDFYVKKLQSKEYYSGMGGPANRDTWHFRDVFLRVMRALDYIKSRPEWNGKDLIVQGGSLGGAQAIAAAALDPEVTLAIVAVPGFCDLHASNDGRQSSFPFQGDRANALLKSNKQIRNSAAYFDMVNFARLIRCPIYVCTGFIDNSCYPSNVIAFYNAIPSSTEKHLYTNPYTGHGGTTYDRAAHEKLKRFFDKQKHQ